MDNPETSAKLDTRDKTDCT